MNIDPARSAILDPNILLAASSNTLQAANSLQSADPLQTASGPSEFQQQFRDLLNGDSAREGKSNPNKDESELHKAFNDFVGQTLFGRLIASMRATQQEPAYMHGGQAEKIFQSQFDQLLAEEMTKASADTLADPMYELFRMPRP